MRYRSWDRAHPPWARGFDERAYRRDTLGVWDSRWHALSSQARYFFLNIVKIPPRTTFAYSVNPGAGVDLFPPHVLGELSAAGFVKVVSADDAQGSGRVVAGEELHDFAMRIRTLRRLHLLDAGKPSELQKYVEQVYFANQLLPVLGQVIRSAGIDYYPRLTELLDRQVTNHRWPGWVARELDNPLAEQIVDAVEEAGESLLLSELPSRVKAAHPDQLRLAVNLLVSRLALFEDLHPETWELLIGFLPVVAEGLVRASRPRERPPLLVCDCPNEVAPDDGMIINDLRTVLLEIASEPPRLRQDDCLYQRENDRFAALLELVAPWLIAALESSGEERLSRALGLAYAAQLVIAVSEGKTRRLQLSARGREWVSSGVAVQYGAMYQFLYKSILRKADYSAGTTSYFAPATPFRDTSASDVPFLGEWVVALKPPGAYFVPQSWQAKPDDKLALRRCLEAGLAELEPGIFYRLSSVAAHLAFGEQNPVNRGLDPDEVVVLRDHRPVPAFEEQREEAGRQLIDAFVRRRLIPLGCVQAAIDESGQLCIARRGRLDAYFGHDVAQDILGPVPATAARVVVQPDFSIVIVGNNSAALAELAPFCERARRGNSRDAVVLRITREAVIKAVSHGLKPQELTARLERHASNEMPANVRRELAGWAGSVRLVDITTLRVVRCPDSETADRVMGALGRQAERVNDTLVAIDHKNLTPGDRNKLKAQGIIVEQTRRGGAGEPDNS
jgi:hypothetical protein